MGEDLSVTDRSEYGDPHAGQVEQHAAAIAARAAALSAADHETAAKIAAAATEMSNHGVAEQPADETIQAVDFKQGPAFPIPERPWEYNNGYTTTVNARGLDGKIVDGGSLVSLDEV